MVLGAFVHNARCHIAKVGEWRHHDSHVLLDNLRVNVVISRHHFVEEVVHGLGLQYGIAVERHHEAALFECVHDQRLVVLEVVQEATATTVLELGHRYFRVALVVGQIQFKLMREIAVVI